MERMDRLNRLNQIWSWLPAFRAVAETENLQEASDNIHTSPPALSRSIGLLEDTLGVELFDREGRGLELNEQGRHFLETVRRVMRLLDDQLMDLQLDEEIVEVHVAFHPRLEWMAEHPDSPLSRTDGDSQIHLSPNWSSEIEQHLRAGKLDLVLAPRPAHEEALEAEHIGTLEPVLCYSADDTFADLSEEERTEQWRERGFIAPNRQLDANDDGWPPTLDRSIEIRASRLHLVRRLCLDRHLLALLPRTYVEEVVPSNDLEYWHFKTLNTTDVYALHRSSLHPDDPWSEWIEGFARCL